MVALSSPPSVQELTPWPDLRHYLGSLSGQELAAAAERLSALSRDDAQSLGVSERNSSSTTTRSMTSAECCLRA